MQEKNLLILQKKFLSYNNVFVQYMYFKTLTVNVYFKNTTRVLIATTAANVVRNAIATELLKISLYVVVEWRAFLHWKPRRIRRVNLLLGMIVKTRTLDSIDSRQPLCEIEVSMTYRMSFFFVPRFLYLESFFQGCRDFFHRFLHYGGRCFSAHNSVCKHYLGVS